MPLVNQLHVDKLLTNVSVKYRNAELIGSEVAPVVPVKKDTDLYRIYSRNFRIPETLRANKGLANEFYFDVSTASYALEKHALKDYVSDDDKQNYDIFDLKADTVEELQDAMDRRMEKSVADLFTTTNWSLNVSLAAAWTSNTTTTNPIPTVDTGATEILQNSGKMPNFGFIPRTSYVGAKNHTSIAERVKYVSKDITLSIIAGFFDLERMVIAQSFYDTSDRGATESISNIWGDSTFICWKPANPGPKVPAPVYIFKNQDQKVVTWREEERESEAIEVRMKYQPKVVASLTGFLIKGTE